VAGARGSEGGGVVTRSGPNGRGSIARTASGDVDAGRDGNVYRKQDGSWQKWNNGEWYSAERPQPVASERTGRETRQDLEQRANDAHRSLPTDQLNRDWTARNEGAERMRSQESYRQAAGDGGGRDFAGSYRSAGGSARVGGGGGGARFGGG